MALAVQAMLHDGGALSEDSNPASDSPIVDRNLTATYLQEALDSLSAKLISSWSSHVDTLSKDNQELGARTSHNASKITEFASDHNDLAEHVQRLEQQLTSMDTNIIDAEDQSCRNNLRLRGIPEPVAAALLPTYVHGLLKVLAPEVPTDMLLLDWVH
ncbi:Hypothetical predicted protein [Pelobates cultripes]|uniref:Uncharacterized protein n=1 Tax=Pelobates cultripes TaxID=61616 RepID=A0AAD1SYR5_PELCU|nr:Hypothetical predicted protein [Pelobates cultripes]